MGRGTWSRIVPDGDETLFAAIFYVLVSANIDAVIDQVGNVWFNEVNARLGGSTHLHHIAKTLVGPDWTDSHVATGTTFLLTAATWLRRRAPQDKQQPADAQRRDAVPWGTRGRLGGKRAHFGVQRQEGGSLGALPGGGLDGGRAEPGQDVLVQAGRVRTEDPQELRGGHLLGLPGEVLLEPEQVEQVEQVTGRERGERT
ncbi:hypothetical protein [Streptomyces aurantiacus]|uniref:hypothetical protein n=1 Tax=Streptomyces aurantiacus TaxID=47760 RepID=UPI0006E15665|nr:hypothetical protein [Streptomyces aurantiacus]